MKKHREVRKHSLLAAALLAVAIGPSYAGDTTQIEEQLYRESLLKELRQDLKQDIESMSLERADIIRRIANQEATTAREASLGEVRPGQPRRPSPGATL